MSPLLLVTFPPLFFFCALFFYQYREFSTSILYQNVSSPRNEMGKGVDIINSLPSSWEKFDGKRHLTLKDLQQVEKIVRFHHSDPYSKTENESKLESETGSESEPESEMFGEYFDSYWNSHENIKLFPFAQLTNVVFSFLLENYGEELGSELIKGCELILFKMIIKSWFQVEEGVENLPSGFSGGGFEEDQEILKLAKIPIQKCMSSLESNPFPSSIPIPGEARQEEEITQRTITSLSLSRHHRRKKRRVKRKIRYLYRLKSKMKKGDHRKDKSIQQVNVQNGHGKINQASEANKREKKRISRKHKRKHSGHQIINSEQVNEIMIIEQREEKNVLRGALMHRPQTRLQVQELQLLQKHPYFLPIHVAHVEDQSSDSDEEKEHIHLREVDMMSFFEKNTQAESFNNIVDNNQVKKDAEKEKGSENVAAKIFWFGYELFRHKCHNRLSPVENERLMNAFDKILTMLISQYHYDPLDSSSTYKDIYLVIFQMETEQDLENSVKALHKILNTSNFPNIRKPFTNTLLK